MLELKQSEIGPGDLIDTAVGICRVLESMYYVDRSGAGEHVTIHTCEPLGDVTKYPRWAFDWTDDGPRWIDQGNDLVTHYIVSRSKPDA